MENNESMLLDLFNYFISQSQSNLGEKVATETLWNEFSELIKYQPYDYFKIYSFLTKINSSTWKDVSVEEKIVSKIHESVKTAKTDQERNFEKKLILISEFLSKREKKFDNIDENFYNSHFLIDDCEIESIFQAIIVNIILSKSILPVSLKEIFENSNTRFHKSFQNSKFSQFSKELLKLNSIERKLSFMVNNEGLIIYLGACLKEYIYRYLEDVTIIKDQEDMMKNVLSKNCKYSDQLIQIIAQITKYSIEIHSLFEYKLEVCEFELKESSGKIILFNDSVNQKFYSIAYLPETLERKKKIYDSEECRIKILHEKIEEEVKKTSNIINSITKESDFVKSKDNQENINSKSLISYNRPFCEASQSFLQVKVEKPKTAVLEERDGRNLTNKWTEMENGVFEIDISTEKEIKEKKFEAPDLKGMKTEEKPNERILKTKFDFQNLAVISKSLLDTLVKNTKCLNEGPAYNDCIVIL